MRNKTADVVKGVAILLIIFGHSICANISNYNDDLIYNVIYSFHVPLFFAVSGYFAYGGNQENWMVRKTFVVLVPFFVFSILNYVLGYIPGYPGLVWHEFGLIKYIEFLFLYNWGLWFLVVLWWCYLYVWKIEGTYFWAHVFCRVGFMLMIPSLFYFGQVFSHIQYKNILGVAQIPWYFWFFFGGYLVSKYREYIGEYTNYVLAISVFAYLLLMILTDFVGGWTSIEFTSPTVAIKYYGWWVLVSRTLQAVFGILTVVLIAKILSRFKVSNVIAYIGTMTLALYVLSGRFLSWGFGGEWLDVITGSVIAFVISYIIIMIVRRIKWADIILFGSYKKMNKQIKIKVDKFETWMVFFIVVFFGIYVSEVLNLINGNTYLERLGDLIFRMRGQLPNPELRMTFLISVSFLFLMLLFVSIRDSKQIYYKFPRIFFPFKIVRGEDLLMDSKLYLDENLKNLGFLLYVWNCGGNNMDGDFEWWEWYGINPVKRWWKRTMGSYIIELSCYKKSDTILHLGCGSSPLVNKFKADNIGIDKNADKINFLKESSDAKLFVGDISDIRCPEADIIICSEVLEYLSIEQCEQVFKIMNSKLKNNGRVIVTIPNSDNGICGKIERILHRKERERHSYDGFNSLMRSDIERIGGEHGLDIVSERHLFNLDSAYLLERTDEII